MPPHIQVHDILDKVASGPYPHQACHLSAIDAFVIAFPRRFS